MAGGQGELDLGLGPAVEGGRPLPITSSRMGHLVDALEHAYQVLGFEDAAGCDEVFRHLVLARIIEPSSKLDSPRVLEETGVVAAPYRTLKRWLPGYAKDEWRQSCLPPAPPTPGSGRPASSSTTCPLCYADVGIRASMPTFSLCRCSACCRRSGCRAGS
jgi:hypothetical protein